ncbi:SRPBCC domain-containing protein [Aeromicrobium alkaliterrae]|uniref:Activator of Hsp90 ATPase homologue 1/2-like C-terminal domain-containing protein n=1 Tax=Aeromicrobium alkaliterrae TaxID=302168 RepID=A0ABN2JEC8_9ACTN
MSATPTGYLTRRGDADHLAWDRTFDAPASQVWAAITVSERLAPWIGTWTGDPADGFVMFSMNAEGDEGSTPMRYDIPACDEPRLLKVDCVSDWGTWNLGLELAEADGVTTLTMTQLVNDVAAIENIGPGWEYYLDRLVLAETGGDVAGAAWDDYYPAQREHYVALADTLEPGIRERLGPPQG